MTIKLVAIDIDGTLLNSQHQITPRVKAAIDQARAQGVYVVVTTGRPFIGAQPYLRQLAFDQPGEYCITNNGALVQQAASGDIVAEITLSFNDYLYCEKLARTLQVHFHALDKSSLYTANKDISQYTVQEASMNSLPLRYRGVEEMDPQMTFPKVMIIDHPELLDKAISQLPAETWQNYTILRSAPYYLEILNKRVDKGQAVKALAEQLGLTAENIMTIGDHENDLAMLEYAGIGVAMGNAIDSAKAVSQFITASNDEHGVAVAIEKFVLQAQ